MKFEKEAPYVPSMNRRVSWNILLLFCILIFGFAIATILKPQNARSEAENRTLAQRPALTWSSLISGQFEKDYETYLSDQFVLRDRWIGLKTGFERAAGRTEINGVYLAKDHYMIESHDGTFTADQAQANIRFLSSFAQRMAASYDKDHFTVMLVPNAVDILRDKLPPFADPYDEEVYLGRIKEALPEGIFFDASAILQGHKEEEIYYRTDHHWKTLGAWYVYQAWARDKGLAAGAYEPETVTDSFEGTVSSKLGIKGKADSIQRYDPAQKKDYYLVYQPDGEIRNSVYQDSFLRGKDKYSYFYGGNYGLIQTILPGSKTGRRLLIIKDSYAHCFAPFTYGNFDQVDQVDLRYYNASLAGLIQDQAYTDILFLQNAAGFAEETSLAKLAM